MFMPYKRRSEKPLSLVQRERIANERREANQARYEDPVRVAAERLRFSERALADARIAAEREFLAQGTREAGVECPITHQHRAMHPQKAERIRRLMNDEGWTSNPFEPITGLRTLEEITAEHSALPLAQLEENLAALLEAQAVEQAELAEMTPTE